MHCSFIIFFFFYFVYNVHSKALFFPDEIISKGKMQKNPKYVFVEMHNKDGYGLDECKVLGTNFYSSPPPVTELEEKVYLRRVDQTQLTEITNGGYAALKEHPQFVYCQHLELKPKFRDLNASLAERLSVLSKSVVQSLKSVKALKAMLESASSDDAMRETLREINDEILKLKKVNPSANISYYHDSLKDNKSSLHLTTLKDNIPNPTIYSLVQRFIDMDIPQDILLDESDSEAYGNHVNVLKNLVRVWGLTEFYLKDYDTVNQSDAYKKGYYVAKFQSAPSHLVVTMLKIKKLKNTI